MARLAKLPTRRPRELRRRSPEKAAKSRKPPQGPTFAGVTNWAIMAPEA